MDSTTGVRLVPTPDFSMFEGFREGDSVKASLSRLTKLVLSGTELPPIGASVANSTYALEVLGPSLQCSTPSSDVIKNIDAVFEGTSEMLGSRNSSSQQTSVYVAFTPFTAATYSDRAWPIDDIGRSIRNSSSWSDFIDLCVKKSQPACSLIAPTMRGIPDMSTAGYSKTIDPANALWLRLDNERLSCSVQKTRYSLQFDARQPVTTLKSYTFRNEGLFEADSLEHAGFITAMQSLLDVLTGATYFNPHWCYLAMMQMTKCTSALPYVVSETSVHETALTALVYQKAAEIRNKIWAIAEKEGIYPPSDPIPSADPVDIPLTRDLTLGAIIEEMSRNMTLSVFTDPRYLSYNSTTAVVTTSDPINVYSYNMRNLILAYAMAICTSILAVIAGLYVFATNGCKNSTGNFSSITCTTIRNRDLTNAMERTACRDRTPILLCRRLLQARKCYSYG